MGLQLRRGNWVVGKLLQVMFDGPSLSGFGCTLLDPPFDGGAPACPTVSGSHFLPEMVCLALLHGLRLVEVPVNYRVRVGESKITGSTRTVPACRCAHGRADPALPAVRPVIPKLLALGGARLLALVGTQLGRPLMYDDANFALAAKAVADTGLAFGNQGWMTERGDFS